MKENTISVVYPKGDGNLLKEGDNKYNMTESAFDHSALREVSFGKETVTHYKLQVTAMVKGKQQYVREHIQDPQKVYAYILKELKKKQAPKLEFLATDTLVTVSTGNEIKTPIIDELIDIMECRNTTSKYLKVHYDKLVCVWRAGGFQTRQDGHTTFKQYLEAVSIKPVIFPVQDVDGKLMLELSPEDTEAAMEEEKKKIVKNAAKRYSNSSVVSALTQFAPKTPSMFTGDSAAWLAWLRTPERVICPAKVWRKPAIQKAQVEVKIDELENDLNGLKNTITQPKDMTVRVEAEQYEFSATDTTVTVKPTPATPQKSKMGDIT